MIDLQIWALFGHMTHTRQLTACSPRKSPPVFPVASYRPGASETYRSALLSDLGQSREERGLAPRGTGLPHTSCLLEGAVLYPRRPSLLKYGTACLA